MSSVVYITSLELLACLVGGVRWGWGMSVYSDSGFALQKINLHKSFSLTFEMFWRKLHYSERVCTHFYAGPNRKVCGYERAFVVRCRCNELWKLWQRLTSTAAECGGRAKPSQRWTWFTHKIANWVRRSKRSVLWNSHSITFSYANLLPSSRT